MKLIYCTSNMHINFGAETVQCLNKLIVALRTVRYTIYKMPVTKGRIKTVICMLYSNYGVSCYIFATFCIQRRCFQVLFSTAFIQFHCDQVLVHLFAFIFL